jgi:hypothetical protein
MSRSGRVCGMLTDPAESLSAVNGQKIYDRDMQRRRTSRPRLRLVSGGPDEAILRRKQFEDAHPEIVITPPATHACLWTAHRDGTMLASGYQLSTLLDTLARITADDGWASAAASGTPA